MTEATKHALATLDDLKDDPQNARHMDDDRATGLRYSLREFGDLSGITWNERSGLIVCGHQRLKQLRRQYGGELYFHSETGTPSIRTPDQTEFPIRIVDWDDDKHRAASLAANNAKGLQGEFTPTALDQLAALEASAPDFYDQLRLNQIAAGQLGDPETEEDEKKEDPTLGPPDMELQPYEHYDYVVLLFRNTQDWEHACEMFGLEKVNASPVGKKKIGLGRALDGARVLKMLGAVTQ